MESDQNPHYALDFDLQEVKSRETWCYAGNSLDLKEERPGFMFANESKPGSWLMAHRSWQVTKSRETWCYAGRKLEFRVCG